MAENKEVVGTIEAARLLGVSVRTIQLWVEKGMLSAWKTPGGHRRILRSSLDTALAARDAGVVRQDDSDTLSMLIVEDDQTMQSYYTALVEILRPDAEVRMASDGYEGLVELGRFAPRVMLVDVDMPGMDGITMLRRVARKRIAGDAHIAVVTGLTQAQLETRGGVPEGIPVYSKPLSVDDLRELLESVTEEAEQ